jgi:hypothetical protein
VVETAISLVVGVVLGAAASWLISRHYYRRALADAGDAAITQRLDDCTEGDKTFLVALMVSKEQGIPRYALINVEFERVNGTTGAWDSNTSAMIRSVNKRARHSLRYHSGSNVDEDRQTVSLSDRGVENARYLLRREYRSACFSNIDDNDAQRLAMFRAEHGRDPMLGRTGEGVVSSYTAEP